VTGTGVQMLRTKQGNIYTGFFLNDDEFDDALDECRKRGYLTEEQLDLTYP